MALVGIARLASQSELLETKRGAQWFDGAPLFLMPSAQKVFLPLLEREFPEFGSAL